MMRHLLDKDQGGLFFLADDAEALLLRRIDITTERFPQEIPLPGFAFSGSCTYPDRPNWKSRPWDLARSFAAAAGGQPLGHAVLLAHLDYALGPASEIALLGSLQDVGMIEMLQAIRSRFLPNKSTVQVCGEEIREIAPFTKN